MLQRPNPAINRTRRQANSSSEGWRRRAGYLGRWASQEAAWELTTSLERSQVRDVCCEQALEGGAGHALRSWARADLAATTVPVWLSGGVVELGQRKGVPTPLNRAIAGILALHAAGTMNAK